MSLGDFMNENFDINSVFDNLTDVKFPRWKDLPELDLYMDQVLVLMDKYLCRANLDKATGSDEDSIITSSMVNNYVKKEYMPAPVKKKYGKEHIAHLIIICIMKQSLPIPVIDTFIKSMLEVMPINELLDTFIETYEQSFIAAADRLKEISVVSSDDERARRAIIATRATALSNSGIIVADTIFKSLKSEEPVEKKKKSKDED